MQRTYWSRQVLRACGLAAVLGVTQCAGARGQGGGYEAAEGAQRSAHDVNLADVAASLEQLQAQVRALNVEVATLKEQQQAAQTESAALRKELAQTKPQLMAVAGGADRGAQEPTSSSATVPETATDERIHKLEEYQQVNDAKTAEQSQTKVESSSKYRLRLSGIVLFNTYVNRGTVDNEDFPQIATAPGWLSSDKSFGASLRQSQIGLQGFGPTIAGARASADLHLDFAGGFPDVANGVSFGIVRLRTGTIRFDWEKTSVIAGQDSLFIAPLSPTSVASLAIPALGYSGNLWSWTPQVRVEHRFTTADNTSVLVQAGILDSLTGELPATGYYRSPTWGEASGQPAYAARVAWTRAVQDENITLGFAGYYGRQTWGLGRSIDSWAGMIDFKLPIGRTFEFSSQAFRGRAMGALGGGIGQSVVWKGNFLDAATDLYGLHSIGGWAQLKYKATTKLQFNGAFGLDNPSAGDLRQFGGSQTYYPLPLSKNQSALVNFLYQPRSDVVLSLEYRRLKTFTLDRNANSANVINFSMGYIF